MSVKTSASSQNTSLYLNEKDINCDSRKKKKKILLWHKKGTKKILFLLYKNNESKL